MWISISGDSGVGKTTITQYISDKYISKWYIVNLDILVKEMYQLKFIQKWLQSEINEKIVEKGIVNLKLLRKELFENFNKWKKLNLFLKPLIKTKLQKLKRQHKWCIVEGSIIFSSELDHLMEKNIIIKTRKNILWKRKSRFNSKEKEILWDFQKNVNQKRKGKVVYTLENNGTWKELQKKTESIFNQLLSDKKK